MKCLQLAFTLLLMTFLTTVSPAQTPAEFFAQQTIDTINAQDWNGVISLVTRDPQRAVESVQVVFEVALRNQNPQDAQGAIQYANVIARVFEVRMGQDDLSQMLRSQGQLLPSNSWDGTPLAAPGAGLPAPQAFTQLGSAPQASGLSGNWCSTEGASKISYYTGDPMGYAFYGESYVFSPDGRFRYAISSDGDVIQGVATVEGFYRVRADGAGGYLVELDNCTASWRPKPGINSAPYSGQPRPECNRAYRASVVGGTLTMSRPTSAEQDYPTQFYATH